MMPARIRTVQTFVLECDEHPWFIGSSLSDSTALGKLAEHNHLFHNDPEKEESWPTSASSI